MTRNTLILLGSLASLALTAGCSGSEDDENKEDSGEQLTECEKDPDACQTGPTAPIVFEADVGSYSLNIFQLAIDLNGNVVPFDITDGSETQTADPTFFAIWGDSLGQTLCVSAYEIESTLVKGGPFDFVARTDGSDPEEEVATWNAWEWSFTRLEDDCADVLTKESQQLVADFIPESLFFGAAPLAGPLGSFGESNGLSTDSGGLIGIWSDDDTDAEGPADGGLFIDQRLFSAFEWDGKSAVSAEEELSPKVGLSKLKKGDNVLTGALLFDEGGWNFTFQ